MTQPRAVVVGGSSGIGLATAVRLAETGATVHIVGRDRDRLATATADHPGLVAHRADFTIPDEIASMLQEVGSFDWLILAASSSQGAGPLRDLELDTLRSAFEGKFWGHLATVQAALPRLSSDGSITLVGAISARSGIPGTAGLSAVNGAVESLVKPLAVELAPLRVNAVSPGVVDTPWWDDLGPEARERYFEQTARALPVGRVASPEDVAECIVMAAVNPNLTGTVIECDGGARLAALA